ncbi:hypothetical protein NM208_g9798 [Fusarium decemcellulare]|uniref:Uncharacterized protein n=1 Tax=Fusarium decemcellulare TaxID=57161 RepID=A0ACC1S069_9HYPO|nr:hypothetical protein NM208_g9798 [Fusarium decemcellulare]
MGKVHGSLARAGKVKSQTPKVEPQEKTKVPKGRALKRLKYTRRFVNVTMTGGKRKVSRHGDTRHQGRRALTMRTDEPQPRIVNDWLGQDLRYWEVCLRKPFTDGCFTQQWEDGLGRVA